MNGFNLRIVPIDWHPRYSYAIAGLKVNGKRKRLYFRTASEAKGELEPLKIKARRQGQAGLDLPDALRAEAADAARRLEPYNKGIRDAVDFYLNHLKAAESAQVGALVEGYLRAQERGALSARHLADLRRRLSRFGDTFGARPCRTVLSAEIEDWLFTVAGGGNAAAQTVCNWRSTLHALFAWAARQKMIEANPLAGVAKPKVIRPAPTIWTPAELERLLRAAPAALLPGLVLQAFCGLRTAEFLRLEWREVDLSAGLVTVAAAKSKTAARRLITIPPNAAEWLAPYVGATGSVWAGSWRAYHDGIGKVCKQVGVKWRPNALRHSFASHHIAYHRNAAALALEMGNSARMVFDFYREVVSPEEAARYWEIRPGPLALGG
jgi:integrase